MLIQVIYPLQYIFLVYTFQWYKLFKLLVLDEEVSNNIAIDELIILLFNETELNISYTCDLATISASVNFEAYK